MLNKIKENRINARKKINKIEYEILTLLLGEVETIITRGSKESSDSICTSTAKKLIKTNTETLNLLNDPNGETTGRVQYLQNIVLMDLLPEEYSESQIREIIQDSGLTNIGEIMKFMEAKHSGKYDRSLASKIARGI